MYIIPLNIDSITLEGLGFSIIIHRLNGTGEDNHQAKKSPHYLGQYLEIL